MQLTIEVESPNDLQLILEYIRLLPTVKVFSSSPASIEPVKTAPVEKPEKDFSKYWGSAKTGMSRYEIDQRLNPNTPDQVAEDDVMQYFGILESGLTSEELDQKLTQTREEWDRNF